MLEVAVVDREAVSPRVLVELFASTIVKVEALPELDDELPFVPSK